MRDLVGWSAVVLVGAPLAFASVAAMMFGLRAQAGRAGAVLVGLFGLVISWRTEIVLDAPALWVMVGACAAGAAWPLLRRA